MVSDLPLDGTVPAKLTVPETGAATAAPVAAPMSMPRCSPASYGRARSNENGASTGPRTGQVQAPAQGAQARNATSTSPTRRIEPPLLSVLKTREAEG
jgi:hypothetical protein